MTIAAKGVLLLLVLQLSTELASGTVGDEPPLDSLRIHRLLQQLDQVNTGICVPKQLRHYRQFGSGGDSAQFAVPEARCDDLLTNFPNILAGLKALSPYCKDLPADRQLSSSSEKNSLYSKSLTTLAMELADHMKSHICLSTQFEAEPISNWSPEYLVPEKSCLSFRQILNKTMILVMELFEFVRSMQLIIPHDLEGQKQLKVKQYLFANLHKLNGEVVSEPSKSIAHDSKTDFVNIRRYEELKNLDKPAFVISMGQVVALLQMKDKELRRKQEELNELKETEASLREQLQICVHCWKSQISEVKKDIKLMRQFNIFDN